MRKRITLLATALVAATYGTYAFLRPDPEADLEEKIQTLESVGQELKIADQRLEDVGTELKEPKPNLENIVEALEETGESMEKTVELNESTTEEKGAAQEPPTTTLEEDSLVDFFLEKHPEAIALPQLGSLPPHLASSEEFMTEILPYFDELDTKVLDIAAFLFEDDSNKYLDPVAINNGEYWKIEEKWEKFLQTNLEIAKNIAVGTSLEKRNLLNIAVAGEGRIAVIDSLLGDERVPEYDRTYLEDVRAKIGETIYGIELEEGKSILELLEEHMKEKEQSQEQGSESSKLYTPPVMLKVAEATQATATTQSLTI